MLTQDVVKVSRCAGCSSPRLYQFLDLGLQPMPNAFLLPQQIAEEERYPLGTQTCLDCGLVQLTHNVSPEKMFRHYLYVPSTSQTMVRHFQDMAASLVEQLELTGALVVDVGSNDGTLLRFFKSQGTNVLGVDPAENLAEQACAQGIPTLARFFGPDTATEIVSDYGKAMLVTATNCLAHVPDIHGFVNGVRQLLADEGVFVTEFPYLLPMLNGVEFDTIYHEHAYYLSLVPLEKILKFWDMRIFHVEYFPQIHGGSLRVFICKNDAGFTQSPEVFDMLYKERTLGLVGHRFVYDMFNANVHAIGHALRTMLIQQVERGKRVIGIGAPAKASVLLNFTQIGPDLLPSIADSIPLKQGRVVPGMHIPVVPEANFAQLSPAIGLVLPWNFAAEIRSKYEWFVRRGGQLVVAIPRLMPI